ncbi:MAG: hypothetical protein HZB76_07315 [Chlamydiae bacterium]|nr:hypothetical protein [Chlamydiota bacterium]
MRIIFFTVFLIFMVGCSDHKSSDYEPSKRAKIEHEVSVKTVKEICQNKNLKCIGFGGGDVYDIRMLSLSFKTHGKVNVDEARELIVYCAELFLSNINANEKMRPLLHNFPFTRKNIEIRIFSETEPSNDYPLYISYAAAIEGVVTYYKNNQFDRLEQFYQETYEEALKKVKAKQASLPSK